MFGLLCATIKTFIVAKCLLVKISLVNSKEWFHLGSTGTRDLSYKMNWPPASYLQDNSSGVRFLLEFTLKRKGLPSLPVGPSERAREGRARAGWQRGFGGVAVRVPDMKESPSQTDTPAQSRRAPTPRHARPKPRPEMLHINTDSHVYGHTRLRCCRQASSSRAHREIEMQSYTQTPPSPVPVRVPEPPSRIPAGVSRQAGLQRPPASVGEG